MQLYLLEYALCGVVQHALSMGCGRLCLTQQAQKSGHEDPERSLQLAQAWKHKALGSHLGRGVRRWGRKWGCF